MTLRIFAMVVLLGTSATAFAQDLSPAERQAAAEGAYDRGTRSFRAGDFANAARWYETANNLAPAAAALLQAIRAHERARNMARAATLALHLRDQYGEERMRAETPVLEREQANLFRIDIRCEGCELEIDGEAETLRALYLAPDTEHTLLARFSQGDVEQRVMGSPGERRELVIEAPPPSETPTEETPTETVPEPSELEGPTDAQPQTAARARRVEDESDGLPVWVVIAGASVTAVALGVTIWSGLDTVSAADEYERMPTRPALEDGRDLEARTNVLIGTTIGCAAATAVIALFTDFDSGSDDERNLAFVAPIDGGVLVGARGAL